MGVNWRISADIRLDSRRRPLQANPPYPAIFPQINQTRHGGPIILAYHPQTTLLVIRSDTSYTPPPPSQPLRVQVIFRRKILWRISIGGGPPDGQQPFCSSESKV